MSRNEKGFGLVGVLLIVLIAGLIGTVGWLVYDRQQNKNDKSTNDQRQAGTVAEDTPDQSAQPGDETASWKEEKSIEFGFSYKYPNDSQWESYLIKSDPSNQLYSLGERVNSAGVDYTGCGRNCGAAFSFNVAVKGSTEDVGQNYVENIQMNGNSYYKLSSKTTVNKNGISGTRWAYQPNDNNAAEIIYYYFVNDKYAYFVQINANGANTDSLNLTDFGEKIFETFQFI